MKSFDKFLSERREDIKLKTAARLMAESGFDVHAFARWYMDEGIYMDSRAMQMFTEGWGDAWKAIGAGAAKGAGLGGVAGGIGGFGLPGAGIGAGVGAVAGGLYGAGKHLWNKFKGGQYNHNKDQALEALNKLKMQIDQIQPNLNSEVKTNFDNLINQVIQALENPSTAPAGQPQKTDQELQAKVDTDVDAAMNPLVAAGGVPNASAPVATPGAT